jgi:hypothetical protein
MNIFVLDEDPERAARDLCDQHVVKMVVESAQILSTALWHHGVEAPYKPTHARHPCVLWAGAARPNFGWLAAHGLAMSDEYTRRYKRTHSSTAVVCYCASLAGAIPDAEATAFVQAMPESFKGSDAVRAYRTYYIEDKARFARWAYCDPPSWWPRLT